MVVVVVSHFVHMAKSEKIHMLEQMVWLIDFKGWTAASIFVKVTHETTKVLQNHYPERLGVAILYNPPKIFESFWTVLNPFLEPKTYRKVKFVYSKDSESMKIMEELFDMDKAETALGGKCLVEFSKDEYRKRMGEDNAKDFSAAWLIECTKILVNGPV
ncbi:uncharacterized protein LOC131030205 [Cryptomeria japonica]|uniref:uncharacterized protein LOC131030205 n=1 Tax=Cryptomeria japonica TaxID=3369 RepID=UPI0025AD6BBE|nr:uncharacterized protein LOC131030205 [Cryptomeria japonica]